MDQDGEKEKVVQEWLSFSAHDLESAKVLHDNDLFAPSLYHLQQSNEKLAKALLLRLGFLTTKTAREDWAVKSILGFLPKEPPKYSHRTLASFLSDLEKSVPAIEDFLTLMKASELGPTIAEFHGIIRESKKGVQKLRKKPFSPVKTAGQLDREIKASQAILDAMDAVIHSVAEKVEEIDPRRTVQIITGIVKEAGLDVKDQEFPSFDSIKTLVMTRLRISMLATLSVAWASLLDPLQSITRYPGSQYGSFDQKNPYVKHFNGLYEVIACLLDRGRSSVI